MVKQWFYQFKQVAQTLLVDNQAVEGIANANTTCLGVADDSLAFLHVAIHIEVGVHHTSTRLDDRNTSCISHEIYQATTTTRNAQVDIAYSIQHLASSLVGGRQQCHDSRVYIILF